VKTSANDPKRTLNAGKGISISRHHSGNALIANVMITLRISL